MKPLDRLKLWLVPAVGYALIRGLARSLRLQILHRERVESLWASGQNVIIAFWHGRQLMMPFAYTRRVIDREARIEILISQHRDGELIARTVRRFGFGSVRGSSTRSGSRALRELIRLGRSGGDLVVTPDGPRGPRCIAQPGVIQLAKVTQLPIVPLTFSASKKNSLGAGIASKSRCRSAEPVFSGVSRSGSQRKLTRSSLRASGWNCRPH